MALGGAPRFVTTGLVTGIGRGAVHTAVHGFVGEAVGVLVFVAERMGDLEPFELGDATPGLVVEGLQVGTFDLVLPLDLLDHQLGVGDDAQARIAAVERELEAAQQAGVLGKIIGANAEELAEFGEDAAVGALNEGSVTRGTGIAASAAVAVGGDPATAVGTGVLATKFSGKRLLEDIL